MLIHIIWALGAAFLLAAGQAISTDFSMGNILFYFSIYGMMAAGIVLLVPTAYKLFLENSHKFLTKTRRPDRSHANELGSGDMASRAQAKQWLEPSDENDTLFEVHDLRGSEKLTAKDNKLCIPSGERNRHILIIAKTGSGKTTKTILPILYSDCLSKTRSTVVIDSKPEMWEKLAEMTRFHNPEKKILLFNPLDTARSLSWNILSKINDDTDAKLIANTLIMATDNPAAKSDSPFFRNNALSLLNAVMVGLLSDNDEKLSMPRVHELVNSGKEALCDWIEVHPESIRNAKTFVELARSGSQNADTILSELGMRLAAWDLKAIRATTAMEELNPQSLIDEPTLLIVEFRESEMEMLRPMANVVVIELLRFLTKAAESFPGHTLPRPVGFVIDEFASALGRLPDIHVKLNTLRSRNVSITAAIQSIAQIKANYEKEADSVIAGFSTKILMPMLDFQDSEWASKETGTMTVKVKNRSKGSNKRVIDIWSSRNDGFQEMRQQRAVLTPDEIGRPTDNCCTFFMPNTPVFQGHIVPFYKNKEMVQAIGMGDGTFSVREAPIEYEENLPDAEELKRQLQEAKAKKNGAKPGAKPAAPAKTPEQLQAEYEQKRIARGWESATGVAKEWWEAFEKQNAQRMPLIIALLDELEKRNATITEFFSAFLYSNKTDIEGNLAYLDQMKAAEAKGAVKEASDVSKKPEANGQAASANGATSQAAPANGSAPAKEEKPPAEQANAA